MLMSGQGVGLQLFPVINNEIMQPQCTTNGILVAFKIHIETVICQATHLNIPLVGVTVICASKEPYASRISGALNVIAN